MLYTDPVFLEHRTENHPESPERLRHLIDRLEQWPLLNRFATEEFRPLNRDALGQVHDLAYVDRVQAIAAQGGGQIEADTVMSRRSYEVACRAAGAAVAGVDSVLSGAAPQAVCLIRPPGHHALRNAAMGFCLFNNVALAAVHALRAHGLNRVLIVDWDVHHGNGTQDIFYESDQVYFFSAHRYPFYPGTGREDETGAGRGLGTTFNLPVRYGTPRYEYLSRFKVVLERAAERCQPELVLISAGFDAHRADPIGSLGLETEDFDALTRMVKQVADQFCQGRIVSVLEGGYNLHALADSVLCHMEALLPEQS